MLRNKNFILTVILPVVISIIIGTVVILLNSTSILNTRAATVVLKEKQEMTNSINDLQKRKKELTYTQADLDKKLEDNRILFDEVTTLEAELKGYTEDAEAAKITIAELDKTIAEKTQYNNNLNNITSQSAGTTKKYTNIKLNVPADIPASRYKAEGTGKILIYTIAGTLADKQDLSLLDSHSYSFNISSGQYIKIEGTLSLTSIN